MSKTLTKREMIEAMMAGKTLKNSSGGVAFYDCSKARPFRFRQVSEKNDEALMTAWSSNWHIKEEPKPVFPIKCGDKVLIRDENSHLWAVNIFSHFYASECPFSCVQNYFKQIIPLKGNKHLAGTTDTPTCKVWTSEDFKEVDDED